MTLSQPLICVQGEWIISSRNESKQFLHECHFIPLISFFFMLHAFAFAFQVFSFGGVNKGGGSIMCFQSSYGDQRVARFGIAVVWFHGIRAPLKERERSTPREGLVN